MGLFAKIFGNNQQAVNRLIQENKAFRDALLNVQNRQVFFNNIFTTPSWNAEHANEAFCTNDQIYSVINKIAETTALLPMYPYEVKADVKQLKSATARQIYSTKAILDIVHLQKKSLEDLPESDWYVKKFAQPNPHENWTEFLTHGYANYLLKGEAIGYKIRLDAGVNAGRTMEVYWLPSEFVTVHLSDSFPRAVEAYSFIFNGKKILDRVPESEFIHIRKMNPRFTNSGEEFRGLSPLEPFGLQRKVMEAIDVRVGTQIQNGAVPGFMYDKSIEYDETSQPELDRKRDAFIQFTRNKNNSGIPYYTAGDIGYIATGLKLADMDIQGLVKLSFKRLCNIYKISDTLFNSDVAATESNIQEMVKQMIVNACLPLAYTFRDALNTQLLNESDDKKRFVDVDISGIPELQDNMKDLAAVIAALPVIPSGNAVLSLFKFEESDEENMKVPLIKQGYSLITDLTIADPIIVP